MADREMTGTAMLLDLRYHNLCVKADAVSLLSTDVVVMGEKYDLEKVAVVGERDFKRLQIVPHDPELIPMIAQGVMKAHPEFIPSIVEEEDMSTPTVDKDGNKRERDKIQTLMFTMPDVDKQRRDFLIEGIKLLLDQCNAKLEFIYNKTKPKLAIELAKVNASKAEVEEAEADLKAKHGIYKDMVKKIHEDKAKEIEEAYANYQAEKEAKDAKDDSAMEAAMSMAMPK